MGEVIDIAHRHEDKVCVVCHDPNDLEWVWFPVLRTFAWGCVDQDACWERVEQELDRLFEQSRGV